MMIDKIIFPDVTKEMLNDPRIKLMDSLFGSYSESESSASNYRETYWFLSFYKFRTPIKNYGHL